MSTKFGSIKSGAQRQKRSHRPGRLLSLRGKHISASVLVKHLSGDSRVAADSTVNASLASAVPALPGRPGKMVLLIGLPAAGKSTISAAFEQAGWVRLNKDSLRKELYGDESILGNAKEVTALFYTRLQAALIEGKNILVDNTNVIFLHRKGPIEAARACGYTSITNVFLNVPLEECLRRNSLRDRKVPEQAMHDLSGMLNSQGGIPSRSEGRLVVLKPGTDPSDFYVDRVRL